MSMRMSFNTTQASDMAGPSHKILPKMTPVSVEETYANGLISVWEKQLGERRSLIVALMLWNPWGAMVYTPGRSTSLRSPNVAKSKHRFWSVLEVWLTSRTSAKESQIVTIAALAWLTKHNVESVHFDIRLRIYRVGETCELISDLIT